MASLYQKINGEAVPILGGLRNAKSILYESQSGLASQNVENALDAVNIKVENVKSNLTNENGEDFRFAYQNGKRGMWIREADTDVFVPFSQLLIPTQIFGADRSGALSSSTFNTSFDSGKCTDISANIKWVASQQDSFLKFSTSESELILDVIICMQGSASYIITPSVTNADVEYLYSYSMTNKAYSVYRMKLTNIVGQITINLRTSYSAILNLFAIVY